MAMQWSPEDWARLGRYLRRSREDQGFSRKNLAEFSGVSEKSIQLAEDGRVPKGRWPQSLNAIEKGLDWVPDTMRRILDEPDFDPSQEMRPLPPPRPTTRAVSLEGESDVSADDLPEGILEALPMVLLFGQLCRAEGAPRWLVEAYDNAAAALVRSLTESGSSQPEGTQGVRQRMHEEARRSAETSRQRRAAARKTWAPSRDVSTLANNPALRAAISPSSPLGQVMGMESALAKVMADLSQPSPAFQAAMRNLVQIPELTQVQDSIAALLRPQITAALQPQITAVLQPQVTALANLTKRLEPLVEAAEKHEKENEREGEADT